MASPTKSFEGEAEASIEFPAVPVRHKKILDKLARCSYCERLCCCIEHCLMHENKHIEPDRERKGSCATKTHEWVEASEMALSSRVVKNEFPFFCVYCKIKVNDEIALRHLMTHGPICPIKKCHWMIPLTIYHEDSKNGENKENIVGGSDGLSSFHCPRVTAKKTPEKSLLRTALRNCLNMSLRTPPLINYEDTAEIMGPFTSTPESDCVSRTSVEADVTPTTPEQTYTPTTGQPANELVGILSVGQRNRIRPNRTTCRVTFACDSEIASYRNEGNENEDENAERIKSVSEEMQDGEKFECKVVRDEDNKENLPLKRINNRKISELPEKH